MAITPTPKNPVTVLRNTRDRIRQRTNITNFSATSKARALMDALIEENLQLRQQTIDAFQNMQLSNATGDDLVEFGRTRGVPFLGQTFSTVEPEEQNVAFYVEAGTFGDINGAASISIPQGTKIWSSPNNNELGSTVDYEVVRTVSLAAGESLAYVAVRATTSGASTNVGPGTLRHHDFTNYVDSATAPLKVVNFYAIMNGRNREREQSHRSRIALHYNRLHQNSDTRLHLTAIEVPGVLNTSIVPGYYGIGTVGVLVLGADAQATPSLVERVQVRLNRFQAPGLRIIASAASQVQFDVELEVKTSRNLLQGERARLEAQIRRSMLNYFRSVGIGGTVRYNELARQIQTQTRGLVRLGATGTERSLFKKVYFRMGFSNGILSEREEVLDSTMAMPADTYPDLGTLTIEWI